MTSQMAFENVFLKNQQVILGPDSDTENRYRKFAPTALGGLTGTHTYRY